MKGADCLTCTKVATCAETSVEKVLQSYWCILHEAVAEPVFLARLAMMQFYGDANAVEAMLSRPPEPEEEQENV